MAPSTRRVYDSGLKCFLNFCALYGFTHLPSLPPPSEEVFISFAVYCAKRIYLSLGSIRLYLASVKHAYISKGLPNPFLSAYGQEMELFKLTMKGIKKITKSSRRKRLPITTSVLKDICASLANGLFSPYLDLLLYTVCIIAFFGFMRCGEFTCDNQAFNPKRNLTLSDVSFQSIKEAGSSFSVCIINLKYSKIDQGGSGTDIKLFANPACPSLCPVRWMRKYLAARRYLGTDPASPLFLLPDMNSLCRQTFISYMRQILRAANYQDADLYSGHSFRSGSATSAAATNMPDYMSLTNSTSIQ